MRIINDTKFKKRINNVSKLASRTANLIHRCFVFRKPEFLMQMFNVFVRSKLENASPVWNPQYKKDIDVIEKVLRRFTKRIRGCKNLSLSWKIKQVSNVWMSAGCRLCSDVQPFGIIPGTFVLWGYVFNLSL